MVLGNIIYAHILHKIFTHMPHVQVSIHMHSQKGMSHICAHVHAMCTWPTHHPNVYACTHMGGEARDRTPVITVVPESPLPPAPGSHRPDSTLNTLTQCRILTSPCFHWDFIHPYLAPSAPQHSNLILPHLHLTLTLTRTPTLASHLYLIQV